jgi:hypothetical protein
MERSDLHFTVAAFISPQQAGLESNKITESCGDELRPRPVHRPARGRKCGRRHPQHGQRSTIARIHHNERLRKSCRAHPKARWPDKTTRRLGLLSDSLVATWSLLVPGSIHLSAVEGRQRDAMQRGPMPQ